MPGSFTAKLLTQLAFSPGLVAPLAQLGAEAQLHILDAPCLARWVGLASAALGAIKAPLQKGDSAMLCVRL
jgi:hypothetical protein